MWYGKIRKPSQISSSSFSLLWIAKDDHWMVRKETIRLKDSSSPNTKERAIEWSGRCTSSWPMRKSIECFRTEQWAGQPLVRLWRCPWRDTWSLSVNIYLLDRRKKYYPRPNEFDYTRLMRDPVRDFKPKLPDPFCYLLFAARLRNSIGQNFAQLEAKVMLGYVFFWSFLEKNWVRKFQVRLYWHRIDWLSCSSKTSIILIDT